MSRRRSREPYLLHNRIAALDYMTALDYMICLPPNLPCVRVGYWRLSRLFWVLLNVSLSTPQATWETLGDNKWFVMFEDLTIRYAVAARATKHFAARAPSRPLATSHFAAISLSCPTDAMKNSMCTEGSHVTVITFGAVMLMLLRSCACRRYSAFFSDCFGIFREFFTE